MLALPFKRRLLGRIQSSLLRPGRDMGEIVKPPKSIPFKMPQCNNMMPPDPYTPLAAKSFEPVSARTEPTALSKANAALIMLNNYAMSHERGIDVSWVVKVIGQIRDHIAAAQSLSAQTKEDENV
jgi:hypothetical protein